MKHGFFSGLLAGSLLAATVATAGDYPYRPANMTDVSIKEGFWLPRFETNRKVTVWADFRKSEETGRIAERGDGPHRKFHERRKAFERKLQGHPLR